MRLLDAALLACLAAGACQLVPLPQALREALSPGIGDFHRRVDLAPAAARAGPLSLVPGAWIFGLGLWATAALFFWAAREAVRSRGARLLARSVAWMGFAASFLALIQPAVFPNHKIYGLWTPEQALTHPVGPIVSKNHFAAWVVLALPLTAGYLAAHIRSHWVGRKKRVQILGDMRALWLLAAGAFMAAALLVTESRSGTIGFSVAVCVGLARGWRGLGAGGRTALLAYLAVLVVAAVVWSSPDLVATRFTHALTSDGFGGRPEIWRQTVQLIGRFWLVGVGLGAFDVAMAVYQTGTHDVLFNHAHNQYLHLLAEGGLLVGVPLVIAIGAFFRVAIARLGQDRTPVLHVREGALAGIVGLAVQCVWEVPLLTPAVLLLLAAAAALAVHVHVPSRTRDAGEAMP